MDIGKVGASPSYLLVGPTSANQCVELWSLQRLPFDKLTAELREMRAELARRISLLRCPSDELIHGVYASVAKDTCDAENILFYNVGLGPFVQSSPTGLRFERTFTDPPPVPSSLSGSPMHYHSYRRARVESNLKHWQRGRIVARWNVDVDAIDILRSASRAWWLLRSDLEMLEIASDPGLGWFGLSLEIRTQDQHRVSAPALMKPLFDGVISAFHSHAGQKIDRVSEILAGRLNLAADEVARHLLSAEVAVLGQRQLLWPWRDSVQWNPADERCVAGELLVSQSEDSQMAVIGELFEVLTK